MANRGIGRSKTFPKDDPSSVLRIGTDRSHAIILQNEVGDLFIFIAYEATIELPVDELQFRDVLQCVPGASRPAFGRSYIAYLFLSLFTGDESDMIRYRFITLACLIGAGLGLKENL